ncbi:hypothetical protein MASR1M60_06530 [Rhodocyclaceae bacterium]
MRFPGLMLCVFLLVGNAFGQAAGEGLTQLREIAEKVSGTPREMFVLGGLYKAERKAGNHLRADQVRERILTHPGENRVGKITVYFFDADYLAQNADFRAAREQWELGKAIVAELAQSGRMPHYLARFHSRQEAALAAILRTEGKMSEADQALARALTANAEDICYYREGPGLRQPRAEHELGSAEGDRANLLSEQISLYLTTGRIGAAELVALDWIQTARGAGKAQQLNGALKRHGDVLMAAGRFSKALARFDEVLLRQQEVGLNETSVPGILARRSRAQALMGLGRWRDAHEAFRNLEVATRGNQAARQVLRAGNDRALTYAMTGKLVEAERTINGALNNNRSNYGPDHPNTVLTEGLRALVLARFGRDDSSLPLFRRYVDTWGYSLASTDPALEESALAQLRHRVILEHYLAVLAKRISQDESAIGEAFRIADALRAGHVQQAVTASASRATASNSDLAALLREDQDLGHAIAALYRSLNERSEDGAQSSPADIRQRLRDKENQRKTLQAELKQQFPAFAQLVHPTPPLPAEVARQLKAQEVLTLITSTTETSYVFTVTANGTARLYIASIGERHLAELVRRMRAALDIGDTPLERLPPFDIAAAYETFQQLLLPLASQWGTARHLIVSTSGALAQIPLSILVEHPGTPAAGTVPFAEYDQIAWLGRRLALSHVPSATAFHALRRLPPSTKGRQPFIGFGDPDFGGRQLPISGSMRSVRRNLDEPQTSALSLLDAFRALAPLPDTRDEILSLASTLGVPAIGTTFLGPAATRAQALSSTLSGKAVVAFATHGLQPGELPGLDQPALAMSLVKGDETPPLLTLTDVLGLKLDADWVVLSACNTAGADGEAAEALSGLGRGFFYAGARALLVTHWPVESESARKLVSATFARYAKDPASIRAEALRSAQLELMQDKGPGFSYAHPLFWAPYSLIGDGGR